jgi:RNA polymerase sigma-54 factor|tara:strand:+ start:5192 stop:6514 length:1323 start_codon:yes stop_codon:yes gene_type:complete
MKLSFNLKLSQSLKLTPLLQQSIKFLQASQAELNDLVEEYLAENLFLEEDGNESKNHIDKYKNNVNNTSISQNYNIFENQIKNQTLKEYLIENISILSFTDRNQVIFSFLIDYIDDNGYLSENLEKIREEIPYDPLVDLKEIEILLKLIQNASLPGIGARNLTECLNLQLDIIKDNPRIIKIAKIISNKYLGLLASANLKQLKNKIDCEENELKNAIEIIKKLNPKPGLTFQKIENTNYISADVTVKKVNGDWVVELNNEQFFKVKINSDYENILLDKNKSNLKDQFQEAKWLVKNLQQRSISILRVSRSIIERQIDFLEKDESYIKPLTLKDIAFELELHESTISRITSNKYISTPHGIFELKYFFGSSIKTKDKENLSSKAILSKIKNIIDNESKNHPYSDEQLCLLLKQQGVNIARRTITKYREILRILPSSKRKII